MMSALPADPARLFLDEACARLDEGVGVIRHCLGQIDDDQVWWRPAAGMNSIGNLVLHLAGNLRQRFEANVGRQADVRDRFGEFTEREAIPRAELLRRFDESVAAAVARLESLSPETLSETRPIERGGKVVDATVLAILFQTLTHLAGHAQEILSMTRTRIGERYVFRAPSLVPPEMRPKG
jgi:hypothetical protein